MRTLHAHVAMHECAWQCNSLWQLGNRTADAQHVRLCTETKSVPRNGVGQHLLALHGRHQAACVAAQAGRHLAPRAG